MKFDKALHLGQGTPKREYSLGNESTECSPVQKDSAVLVDAKLNESTMCTHSPEGQPYSGLHQKRCGQQVEGGDSAPLLRSGESPPGVLRPALEPSAQERHGPVGAGPEQGREDDQGAGASSF